MSAPATERLDRLLAEGRLRPAHARALAAALVERPAAAPRAPDAAPRAAFFRAALDRLAPDTGLPAALRERVEAGLARDADRLLARAGLGRILARAAELTPADVAFQNGRARIAPAPGREIGVPFDAALELAHLSVGLARNRRSDLAERVVSHYANLAEDFDLYRVLGFYEAFCALRQLARERALRQLARECALRAAPADDAADPPAPTDRSPLAAPVLVAMGGCVASGKSTLAAALADALAAPLAVADRIRDHLVHGAPGRPLHEAGWAEGLEPGFGPRVYTEMLRRGGIVLATGRPLVLDACFPTPCERAAARALALRHGARFLFVECRVDAATQRARLAERDAASGAAPGSWQAIAEALEARRVPAAELAAEECVAVDAGRGTEAALAQLLPRVPGAFAAIADA